jgi:hypothetical protein
VSWDTQRPLVGGASLALAKACYGLDLDIGSGHEQKDVLYIGFGASTFNAISSREEANWAAGSFEDFEASIAAIGDKLVETLA